MKELKINLEPPTIFEDNQACIRLAENPVYHGRAKHVDMKFHFVRDHLVKKAYNLVYCKFDDMMADILTKALPCAKFSKFRDMMNIMAKGES